jgi:Ca2+-binding RTX toxin-like protein
MAILFGTAGNNVIVGTAVADFILGYDPAVPFPDGNDNLSGGAGNDSLYGGDGNDTINGGADVDQTFGGNGNDRIIDDDAVNFDVHKGGAGIDTIDYSLVTFGAVTINLTTSLTSVAFGNTETILNFENVEGSQGGETIIGNALGNVLSGNGGNDTINGGAGVDQTLGDDGNDRIIDDDFVNFDVHNGGAGIDTIDYSLVTFVGTVTINTINLTTSLTTDAVGNTETILNFENVEGSQGSDTIIGSIANNLLIGNDGDDRIEGNDGNDTLKGNDGNDTLIGGLGNDTLIGGLGTDTMTDGGGNDVYQFLTVNGSPPGPTDRDILTDFDSGVDLIDLSSIDSDISIAMDDAFTFIGKDAFGLGVGNKGEVRFFQNATDTIIQVDREGDGNLTAEMAFQINGLITPVATDFIL